MASSERSEFYCSAQPIEWRAVSEASPIASLLFQSLVIAPISKSFRSLALLRVMLRSLGFAALRLRLHGYLSFFFMSNRIKKLLEKNTNHRMKGPSHSSITKNYRSYFSRTHKTFWYNRQRGEGKNRSRRTALWLATMMWDQDLIDTCPDDNATKRHYLLLPNTRHPGTLELKAGQAKKWIRLRGKKSPLWV